MLNKPLIVVLPMYNRERSLRSSVMDILELSPSLCTAIKVVVVDDGSTDETYETACELARAFPQVTALRQPVRQGMGAALDLVRRRLNVEMVVVHDGVTPVEASQLRAAVESNPQSEEDLKQSMKPASSSMQSAGSRRFASIRTLHDSMAQVHRSTASFRWLRLESPLIPRRCSTNVSPATTSAHDYLTTLPTTLNSPTQAEI